MQPSKLPVSRLDHQRDSSSLNFETIKTFFVDNLLDKWKALARELDVRENDIEMLARANLSPKERFSQVRTLTPCAEARRRARLR